MQKFENIIILIYDFNPNYIFKIYFSNNNRLFNTKIGSK